MLHFFRHISVSDQDITAKFGMWTENGFHGDNKWSLLLLTKLKISDNGDLKMGISFYEINSWTEVDRQRPKLTSCTGDGMAYNIQQQSRCKTDSGTSASSTILTCDLIDIGLGNILDRLFLIRIQCIYNRLHWD